MFWKETVVGFVLSLILFAQVSPRSVEYTLCETPFCLSTFFNFQTQLTYIHFRRVAVPGTLDHFPLLTEDVLLDPVCVCVGVCGCVCVCVLS